MSTIQETIHQMGKQARAAAYKLAQLSSDEKNAILRAMAAAVRKAVEKVTGVSSVRLLPPYARQTTKYSLKTYTYRFHAVHPARAPSIARTAHRLTDTGSP